MQQPEPSAHNDGPAPGSPAQGLTRHPENTEVRPLELFFDLVYVFALNQISHHLLEHRDWVGVAQTAILFLAVFSVWSFTTWITSLTDTEKNPVRWMLLATMVLGLFMNGALGEAFGESGWLFVSLYLAIQIGRNVWALRLGLEKIMHDHHGRTLVWTLGTAVLWIAGAVAEGELRLGLWGAAALIDLLGFVSAHPLPGRKTDTRDFPFVGEHLIERCRLFLLIALGDTILVTGSTLVGTKLDSVAILSTAIAIIGTIALWWSYFRRSEGVTLEKLEKSADPAKLSRLAVYALMGMVAGLIVAAVADEIVIAHPLEQTDLFTNLVIFGGPALFVLAQGWYLHRVDEDLPRSRPAAFIALAILAVATLPALKIVAAAASMLVLVAMAVADSIKAHREGDRDKVSNH